MSFNPIESKVKFENMPFSASISSQIAMASGKRLLILKLQHSVFKFLIDICPSFAVMWLWTWMIIRLWPSEFFSSNLHEICCVSKGLGVMHDYMSYYMIQGQCHETLKVWNSSILNICLLHHLEWEWASDSWFINYGTISEYSRARFLISILVFWSLDFEFGRKFQYDLAVCHSACLSVRLSYLSICLSVAWRYVVTWS